LLNRKTRNLGWLTACLQAVVRFRPLSTLAAVTLLQPLAGSVASAVHVRVLPPPLSPAATALSSNAIRVTWIDGSNLATGYSVERSAAATAGFAVVGATGPDGSSYTDAGLGAGTTWYYRVRAVGSGGTSSAYSPVVSATTFAAVNRPPVANAAPDQFVQTLTPIPFSGTGSFDSDGAITSYAWAFGDGTVASGLSVSHAYAAAGTYTVTLTVTDAGGLTGSDTAVVQVSNRPPVANAGPDRTADVGTSVAFDGSGSRDADGRIATYAWTFGDGASASGATATHAYGAPGTYTVTLTVVDDLRAQASDTALVTVASQSAPPQPWVKRLGGVDTDLGLGAAADRSGNVIVVGGFNGTVDLGTGLLTSSGGLDGFVASYSPAGTPRWSRRFGGTGTDVARAVAVDAAGNVVVAGYFEGTVDFGGGPLTSGAGSTNVFVARYSPTGTHLWSRRGGGPGVDLANAVAVDGAGNVVVTGQFTGTADFGGGPLTSAFGGYNTDTFIAKYSAAGTPLWAKSFFSYGLDVGTGLAVDGAGNVLVTGYFYGLTDFGGGFVGVAGGVRADIFLVKLSDSGGYVWSRRFGGTGDDRGEAVTVDTAGNIALAALVRDAGVDFGSGVLPLHGADDIAVAEFSPTGASLWSRCLGGPAGDLPTAIAFDGSGNVVLTGYFSGTADLGGVPLVSAGSTDAFVARYSSGGAPLRQLRFGGAGADRADGLAIGPGGSTIVTGSFSEAADFGGTRLTSAGSLDVFLLNVAP